MHMNSHKAVILKKKKDKIKKIQTLTQSTRSASLAYTKSDFYDESIYRMETQEMKNLDKLDQSDIFLSSTSSRKSFDEKILAA